RQMKRDFIKPLILMTPKSLLRLEAAGARSEDFTKGSFREIIGDNDTKEAERVILCSGKVYYDLLNYRNEQKITNAAIVRVEQLYPFRDNKLREAVARFGQNVKIVWCQDEPQ